MKISNGINLKLFLIIIFLSIGVFSLFFVSNNIKVLAQENKIVVETTGYSILSESSFVFGGYYSGNFDKKPFTTYFEFKKNDSNLDDPTDREKTIIIRRDLDVEEYNDFYTSPELKRFSDYYFRAVGCFEENPDKEATCSKDDSTKKYYGEVLHMRTGVIPYGATLYPFSVNNKGIAINNTPSVCTFAQTLVNGVCKDKAQPVCNAKTQDLVNGVCKDKPKQPTCDPKTQDLVNGVCKDKTSLDSDNTGSDKAGPGLVKCGTTSTDPCGFNDFLILINDVIKFVFKDLVLPIAAIMFAYAGFELVTSGGSTEKKSKAKSIFTNVAIGLIVAAAAFLIIQTILSIVGARTDIGIDWFGF